MAETTAHTPPRRSRGLDHLAAYEDLLARAEGELVLAAEGRWDELVQAGAERAALALSLPAAPPAARPVLERLAAVQADLTAALLTARAETLRELGTVRRGRGAVRGYAGAAAARGGWVDESS
jgi:hypothetical protein